LVPLFRSVVEGAPGFISAGAQLYLRAPGLFRTLSTVLTPLRPYAQRRVWPATVVAKDPTVANLLEALRTGPYGRCVYHCDNDVVDNQAVLLEFAGGPSVTFTMHGHSHIEGRTTRLQGARAELTAFFGLGGAWIEVKDHRTGARRRYNTSAAAGAGHGGGDFGLMAAFVQALRQGGPAFTTADQALESHLLAFAAEKARLSGATLHRGANGWDV
jgi:predicted dehydrogenase